MKQEEIDLFKNIWLNNLDDACDAQLKLMEDEYENKVEKCKNDFDLIKGSTDRLKIPDEIMFELLEQVYCNFKTVSIKSKDYSRIKVISDVIDESLRETEMVIEKDKNYTIILMAIEEDNKE